jgi:hypothetical protein
MGARRAGWAGVALAALQAASPGEVFGQQFSVWVDANAAHSRPPAGSSVAAASYGLAGLRLQVDGRGRVLAVSGTAGRGAEDASGSWAAGRTLLQLSQVRGHIDYGIRAEGHALGFLSPVRLTQGGDLVQRTLTGTLAPFAGVSVGGFRVSAEGAWTTGMWRSELTQWSPIGGPLPIGGRPEQTVTMASDGGISVAGGSASLLRIAGAVTVEVRGSVYDVSNTGGDGTYRGGDVNAALSAGPADVMLGARWWDSPLRSGEAGGHFGFGIAASPSSYVQAMVSRTVTDMIFGTPGGLALQAGVALRVGQRTLGPRPPAVAGAPTGGGHRVVFTLREPSAQSVAVAGDFSGWEPRPLTRDGSGNWTLETVLPQGVYHYAFVVDGERWMVPDHASGIVDDGFGQKNATLIVNGQQEQVRR